MAVMETDNNRFGVCAIRYFVNKAASLTFDKRMHKLLARDIDWFIANRTIAYRKHIAKAPSAYGGKLKPNSIGSMRS
jgi:hypothetical protein